MLLNTGNRTCTLSGFPTATLDRDTLAPVQVTPATDGTLLSKKPPTDVVLPPGQVAYFGIETTQNCEASAPPAPKHTLTIVFPDQPSGVTAPIALSLCDTAMVGPFRSAWADVHS